MGPWSCLTWRPSQRVRSVPLVSRSPEDKGNHPVTEDDAEESTHEARQRVSRGQHGTCTKFHRLLPTIPRDRREDRPPVLLFFFQPSAEATRLTLYPPHFHRVRRTPRSNRPLSRPSQPSRAQRACLAGPASSSSLGRSIHSNLPLSVTASARGSPVFNIQAYPSSCSILSYA